MKDVNIPGWPTALEDAKRKCAEGRSYVARMRGVIREIERKIVNGEPWPSRNKAATRN